MSNLQSSAARATPAAVTLTEDWLAVVIGLALFALALVTLTGSDLLGWVVAASVWTMDVARAHRVASKLVFGMVWINDHHRLDPASPWGGFKNSGVGRETGIESFDQFSEPRAVTVNTSGITVDWYADDGQLKRLN